MHNDNTSSLLTEPLVDDEMSEPKNYTLSTEITTQMHQRLKTWDLILGVWCSLLTIVFIVVSVFLMKLSADVAHKRAPSNYPALFTVYSLIVVLSLITTISGIAAWLSKHFRGRSRKKWASILNLLSFLALSHCLVAWNIVQSVHLMSTKQKTQGIISLVVGVCVIVFVSLLMFALMVFRLKLLMDILKFDRKKETMNQGHMLDYWL